MEFLDAELNLYIENHSEKEPEILADLNRRTYIEVLNPRMLAGHLQGRVLSMLTHMIKPKRVLEIGTYTGYSAICFAEAVADDGIIYSIDKNEELEPIQTEFFEKTNNNSKIKRLVGNAVDLISTIDETFDLIFIDADKANYSYYFDICLPKLNPGGYLIADNVLWSGKVVEKSDTHDADTRGILAFNLKVQQDSRVQNVLFPIRDGLMVCRKV